VQFKAVDHVVTRPLFDHINDKYKLLSCNGESCSESEVIDGAESFVETINYIKADNVNTQFTTLNFGSSIDISADGKTMAIGDAGNFIDIDLNIFNGTVAIFTNTNGSWAQQMRFVANGIEIDEGFGATVSLSADGNTLAVSAIADKSNHIGVTNGTSAPSLRDTTGEHAGAVYVFTRTNNIWTRQAYIKPDRRASHYRFGTSLNISADGNTLAIGTTISFYNGSPNLAYVYTRDINTWSQNAVLSGGSNTDIGDVFGAQVSISGDGLTLAVSAIGEDSQGIGIDNENIADIAPPSQTDNTATSSGAIYIFTRDTLPTIDTWSQQAYIKASNTENADSLGTAITLSNDGNTLAVAALGEDSNDRNNEIDNTSLNSGAVYIYTRNNSIWSQQDYLKADNIHANAGFGSALDLSDNGNTLAIGARKEKSSAIGYSGDQIDSEFESGAAYLFIRDTNNKWNQKAYLKASNPDIGDAFGDSISLSGDASILAVGAPNEQSSSLGINNDQLNNDDGNKGAVYVY